MADELTDVVKARKDLLWGMYTDVRAHSRHAETLRSTVVNFMIVSASVLIAVIANDGDVKRGELALCLLVGLVGLLGLAFSASYTELHQRNRLRAVRLRATLDAQFFAGAIGAGGQPENIETLLEAADGPHEASRLYRWSRRLTGSTQLFWLVLPIAVIAAGLSLAAIAL